MRLSAVVVVVACVLAAGAAASPPAGALVSTGDGSLFWRSPQPQGNWLAAVAAVGSHAWAVGKAGTILHSTDAGMTWSPQVAGTRRSFRDVTFVDALTGWAVGGDDGSDLYGNEALSHVIARTVDGGLTWTVQQVAGVEPLNAVTFVDKDTGWTVGDYGTVLHTADGGRSWSRQETHSGASLTSVVFSDAEHGWAGGPSGAVLRTADGGLTWRSASLGRWARGFAISHPAFADGDTGWAILTTDNSWDDIATGETIVATSDGGASWHAVSTMRDLQFSALTVGPNGELRAAAVSQADAIVYLMSDDGGRTWARQIVNADVLSDMVSVGGGVCGVGSGIMVLAGDRWLPRGSWSYNPDMFEMLDSTHGVGLLSEDLSGQGCFVRTGDGVTWDVQPGLRLRSPTGLDFVDGQHGWVVGMDGVQADGMPVSAVYATADGGQAWTRRLKEPGLLLDVRFSGSQRGWVCGIGLAADGEIAPLMLATSDGGATWAKQTLPRGFLAVAIDFTSVDEGWAVGMQENEAGVAHTVDGGAHWELQPVGLENVTLDHVRFFDSQHGWASGSAGDANDAVLLATTDGGQTWQREGQGLSVGEGSINAVAFVDPLHGWLFADDGSGLDGGSAWHTSDGGVTWKEALSGILSSLTDACAADGQVFAAGNGSFVSTQDLSGDSAPPFTYDDVDGLWHRRPVTVKLVAADLGGAVARTEYRLDGATQWRPYAGPIAVAAPSDHSNDGVHVLTYRSVDTGGNVEPSYNVDVPIDTLGPTMTATHSTVATRGHIARLRFTARERTSTAVDVTIRITNVVTHRRAQTIRIQTSVNTPVVASFTCALAPGRYWYTVYATDQAGNTQVRTATSLLVVKPGVLFRAASGQRLAVTGTRVDVAAAGGAQVGAAAVANITGLTREQLLHDLSASPIAGYLARVVDPQWQRLLGPAAAPAARRQALRGARP